MLTALIRKYGDGPDPDLDAVQDWAARAAARLAEIDVSDEAHRRAAARRDAAASRRGAAGRGSCPSASARRRRDSSRRAVTAELAGLAMPPRALHASPSVPDRPRPASPVLTVAGAESGVGPDGADEVEFLLQPHPDAPALPLAAARPAASCRA